MCRDIIQGIYRLSNVAKQDIGLQLLKVLSWAVHIIISEMIYKNFSAAIQVKFTSHPVLVSAFRRSVWLEADLVGKPLWKIKVNKDRKNMELFLLFQFIW